MEEYLDASIAAAAFSDSNMTAAAIEKIKRATTEASTGCWECCLGINDAGYSTTWFAGRMWRTHRLWLLLHHEEVDSNLTIDHLCFNRCCYNPDHLEQVTLEENSVRANAAYLERHGRYPGQRDAERLRCARGHEYGPSDLRPNGRYDCRECHRIKRRERYYTDLEGSRAKALARSRKSRADRRAAARPCA